MDDLISRQAVLDELNNIYNEYQTIEATNCLERLSDAIEHLPTAEPSTTLMQVEVGVDKESLRKAMEEAELILVAEPRKGKWVYDEERGATGIYAICTACDEMIYQTGEFNYCPRCGARMEE